MAKSFPAAKVIVMGDSHAKAFGGVIGCQVYAIGPVTMHRIGRDQKEILSSDKIAGIKDPVIFVFGEIDARCHIGKQRDQNARDEDEVIGDVVTRYLKALCAQKPLLYRNRIAVVSIVPPRTVPDAEKTGYPFYGSIEERARITRKLNAALAAACQKHGVYFINYYDEFVGSDGQMDPKFSDHSVHLNGEAIPIIKTKVYDFLSHCGCLRTISFKQELLGLCAKWYGIDVMVETGTKGGLAIDINRLLFKKIYSIEIEPDRYRRVHQKYRSRRLYVMDLRKYLKRSRWQCLRSFVWPGAHVQIFLGDSAVELPKLLPQIRERCVFWLDAHPMGAQTFEEVPLLKELETIAAHPVKDHLILIDDVTEYLKCKCFPDVKTLRNAVARCFPKHRVELYHTVMMITPPLRGVAS